MSTSPPSLRVTEYTDPGCPFAWSAEPIRARIAFVYGDALEWHARMVGLSSDRRTVEDGYDAETMAGHTRRLARDFGMPIDSRPRPFAAATVPACRAVVAARLHRPEAADAVLRGLRERKWRGQPLDELATLHGAASDAGIDPAELDRALADPAVEEALAEDMRAARAPKAAALALDHKLAGWEGGRRYTCPSLEFERLADGVTMVVPGFQPLAAYEIVIANLVPGLERRPSLESARAVLEWAGRPLATEEVATVLDADPFTVREELSRVARLDPVGADGFWSLDGPRAG